MTDYFKPIAFMCDQRNICTQCRNRKDGKKVREILNRHAFGKLGNDFECPRGLAWDSVIEAVVPQDMVKDTPTATVKARQKNWNAKKMLDNR